MSKNNKNKGRQFDPRNHVYIVDALVTVGNGNRADQLHKVVNMIQTARTEDEARAKANDHLDNTLPTLMRTHGRRFIDVTEKV